MASISNCLKTAWQDIQSRTERQPSVTAFLLLLCCIPMPMGFSSVSLGIFVATAIYTFYKRRKFTWNKADLLPVSLYMLMALSVFWSIDADDSVGALSKEITLLAIPIAFALVPRFGSDEKSFVLQHYSFAMVGFCMFYLMKAGFRLALGATTDVFFYHELVTEPVNAIHVSVYLGMAFCWFLSRQTRKITDWCCLILLSAMIVLLSSKNIIVVVSLLALAHFFIRIKRQSKTSAVVSLGVLVVAIFVLSGKIAKRFNDEFSTAMTANTVNQNPESYGVVFNKSIREAWENKQFTPNDYFPGTALRVYQFRIFTEMLHEDDIFWTGYGLNASYAKIGEKAKQYNLDPGYRGFNFHNQYVQNFADLGVFGFLLILAMVVLTLARGIRKKDFTHISFAVLMISLFLTESFLWRQRGVTFFVAMYCLLNSGPAVRSATKNE